MAAKINSVFVVFRVCDGVLRVFCRVFGTTQSDRPLPLTRRDLLRVRAAGVEVDVRAAHVLDRDVAGEDPEVRGAQARVLGLHGLQHFPRPAFSGSPASRAKRIVAPQDLVPQGSRDAREVWPQRLQRQET